MKFPEKDAPDRLRLTQRGKLVSAIAALAITVSGMGFAGHKAIEGPSYSGNHTTQLGTGGTLSGIANEEVRHGESHTGDVVREIIRRNPEVFQNGTAEIESADLGKYIDVPDSVDDR